LKRPSRRTTVFFGALIASSICIGGTTTALALDATSSTTPQASSSSEVSSYRAKLIVVSDSGAESIDVSDERATVNSLLQTRGYDSSELKDDKGLPLQVGKRLKSGERYVVYGTSVEGTSKTIELRLPDEKVDDEDLYEGETEVEDPGKIGSALKTTVIHRDLSKLQDPKLKPETLSADELTSNSTQSNEENYLTVLEAPRAKKLRVGTKPCGSEYLCDLLKSGKYEELKADGGWVHPLGKAMDWTTYYGSKDHEGGAIDFPEPQGTPIYAVADGTVLNSSNMGAGGNMATIRHTDGTITGYAHMVELPIVKVGDKVKAGQLIGFVGSTGRSTGPHLHFESWSDTVWGTQIPSYDYMKAHGVDLGSCTSGPCSLAKKD